MNNPIVFLIIGITIGIAIAISLVTVVRGTCHD